MGLLVFVPAALAPEGVRAAKKKTAPPPPLPRTYVHRNDVFRLQMPESWDAVVVKDKQDTAQLMGDGVVIRLIYRKGEPGYDAIHGICLSERLTPASEGTPAVSYEYDYVEGSFGDQRTLDSAFMADYGVEVMGHRKWRQQNLTVVGGGHSLCIIVFAPQAVWKKSRTTRTVVEAVLQSVQFKQ
jgi:hypothetical protein